jgi:catechol-2,3-dioxygenase
VARNDPLRGHPASRLPAAGDVAGGHGLLGATDHGVNLAGYLRDPDGNGLELMLDRPSADWPRDSEGGIAMRVDPLDLRSLVAASLQPRS